MGHKIENGQRDRSWDDYYGMGAIPHTLASQLDVYGKMIDTLPNRNDSQNPNGLYVLGGFFPSRNNITAFHSLVNDMNPEFSLNQIRYLDKNSEPARILEEDERTRFFQCNLSQIGTLFPPESIELLVLDHTVEFINDQDLATMVRGLSCALSPSGIALITKPGSRFPFIDRLALTTFMHVPVYPRRDKQFQAELEAHLKVVGVGEYDLDFCMARIYSVARKDSPYPCFANKGGIDF